MQDRNNADGETARTFVFGIIDAPTEDFPLVPRGPKTRWQMDQQDRMEGIASEYNYLLLGIAYLGHGATESAVPLAITSIMAVLRGRETIAQMLFSPNYDNPHWSDAIPAARAACESIGCELIVLGEE